jgi:hypothetical protein
LPPYNNAILVITNAYTSGSDSAIAPKNIVMRGIYGAVGTAPSAFADKIICSESLVSRFLEIQRLYSVLIFGFMDNFCMFVPPVIEPSRPIG